MSQAGFDAMFADLIAQTQRAVDGLGPSAEQLEQAPEVKGTAYDERISVTMRAGRATHVEIQPPARRLDPEDLGDHLVTAINAAIDANLAAMTTSTDTPTDFSALSEQLQAVQAESVRQLDKYTQGMHEMLRQAKEMGPRD